MELEIRHITDEERGDALRLRVYGFGDYPPEEFEKPDIERMVIQLPRHADDIG